MSLVQKLSGLPSTNSLDLSWGRSGNELLTQAHFYFLLSGIIIKKLQRQFIALLPKYYES